MENTGTNTHSAAARLLRTLMAPPWSLVAAEGVDLAAWLSGLLPSELPDISRLTVGECSYALERLAAAPDPAALVAAYRVIRPQQVETEARARRAVGELLREGAR